MILYLVQHGNALSKDFDPERPLSPKGVEAVKKISEYVAANCDISTDIRVCHSGKLRARQTAEIISSALGLSEPEKADGLKPMDDPAVWQSRLSNTSQGYILVGHLPYMGRLTSLLLTGNPEKNIVQFRMGGILSLKREEKEWTLLWQIIPDIIPEIL